MACYIINKNGKSYSVILDYVSKTNKMKTGLLRLIKLLIVLKYI